MVILTWLLVFTPIHQEQLFDVFLGAFLAQGRSTTEQLVVYFNNKISKRLEKKPLIYTAYVDNRMIGYAIFEKWEEGSYYLAEMAILPEYQRRGIGKQLVFGIIDKVQGIKKILLITRNDNVSAQSFYKKIGFIPSSFRHPEYPENFIGYEFSF